MAFGAGAVLLEELAQARRVAEGVDLPPALPGWEGLCALEYTAALGRLREQVTAARRAIDTAIVLAGAL